MTITNSIAALALVVVTGCAANPQVLETGASQVQLRSFQSRAFDTTDKQTTLRTTIATLQDLGFVVEKADATLGTVTATKLNKYALRMTVTVRERGTAQMVVRANAQFNNRPVEEPKLYQDFFTSLEKSMFLTAHQVD